MDALKQLYDSISTTQFLTIVGGIIAALVWVIKTTFSQMLKKNMLGKLFGSEKLEEVGTDVKKISTEIAKLAQLLEKLEKANDKSEDDDKEHDEKLDDLRRDLTNLTAQISRDFSDVKIGIKNIETVEHNLTALLTNVISRLQELENKVQIQLGRLDEIARDSLPEFRQFHRELSKEIAEIQRDLALVERTVHTIQLNNNQNIHLR